MKNKFKLNKLSISVFYLLAMYLFFSLSFFMVGDDFGGALLRRALNSVLLFLCFIFFIGSSMSIGHLVYCFLIAIGYGFVGLVYGFPNRSTVAAFLYTNVDEVMNFFGGIPTWVVFFYATEIVLFVFLIKYNNEFRSSFLMVKLEKLKVVVLLGLLAIVSSGVIKNGFVQSIESKLMEVRFPLSVLSNYREIELEDVDRSILNREVSMSVEQTNEESCQVCVLVIGESVRRDFMGAYGAPWDNTPWMSSSAGLLFTNVYSSSDATAPSLSVSLFSYEKNGRQLYGNNIVSLANLLGYRTFWFSAQGKSSNYDVPASIVAGYANEKKFIDDFHVNKVPDLDMSLLDWTGEALQKKGKLFIVLHLMGSHPLACNRTRGLYDEFFISKELSCYIKSIKNTDYLLSRLASMLRNDSMHRKWGIFYTSDHALGFYEGRDGWALRHSTKERDNFEIPMFVTGSDEIKRRVNEATRSSRYLFHMVAEWLGARVKGSSDEVVCHWLSNEKCQDQTKVRIGYGQFIDVNLLKTLNLKEFIDKNVTH